MSAACPVCNGSGETRRESAIYDCSQIGCTAAAERTALEDLLLCKPCHPIDAIWLAYQAGKAAALEQAAKVADNMLEVTWSGEASNTAESIADQIRALKP